MNRFVLLSLVACQPPSSTARAPLVEQDALIDMVGGWRWLHRTEQDGTIQLEDEQWRLHPTHDAHLAGRYLRTVEVRSTDTLGFPCNQRMWYRQRALIDVELDLDGEGGYVARETGYTAEPSPCDHGFRHLTTYAVEPHGSRMELKWDGGSQILWQVDSDPDEIAAPWTEAATPIGAWSWQTRSYDDDRTVREEAEWWEISPRSDTASASPSSAGARNAPEGSVESSASPSSAGARNAPEGSVESIDATYRRRVTVRNPSGGIIACAGAPSWTFEDTYVLTGDRQQSQWHFVERAVDAAVHPCLRATPERNLDEATGEIVGDFFVLEWRGKRRQVLYRPD